MHYQGIIENSSVAFKIKSYSFFGFGLRNSRSELMYVKKNKNLKLS
jgi:hypothetical protein